MSTWTQERARVASLSRSRAADDPDLIAARQRLKAQRLAEHIARQVQEWPPLTSDQLARLSTLLAAPRAEGGL